MLTQMEININELYSKFYSSKKYLSQSVSAAPLAVFRICFGLMMLFSIIRFWSKGWIEKLYIDPVFHFKYYGFEWVTDLGSNIYLLFIICGLSSFFF